MPRDRNYRTPFDDATAVEHNLQVAYARQFNDTFGFRNTLSYRAVNDDYFVAEFLVVDGDRDVYREYLQFTHNRRPLMNLAEVTGRFTRGVEQNVVLGWEAQRYNNHTDTIPGGGVAEAEYIDLYNPVETQQPITRTIARKAYFTNKTNAFYFQDNLTLGPKVKAMVGGRFDICLAIYDHNNPVSDGVESEGRAAPRSGGLQRAARACLSAGTGLDLVWIRGDVVLSADPGGSPTARRSSPSAAASSSSASVCTWPTTA